MSVTQTWRNFADPKDLVSADVTLTDEYDNSKNISVEDVVLQNGYRFKNERDEWEHNYHKSYGYLRTPELAEHLKAFLDA